MDVSKLAMGDVIDIFPYDGVCKRHGTDEVLAEFTPKTPVLLDEVQAGGRIPPDRIENFEEEKLLQRPTMPPPKPAPGPSAALRLRGGGAPSPVTPVTPAPPLRRARAPAPGPARGGRARAGAAASASAAEAPAVAAGEGARRKGTKAVTVTLEVARRLAFGESLCVVGSGPALGNWDPDRAVPLDCDEAGEWRKPRRKPRARPTGT